MNRRAFTLIELLVVMGIIALLTSILIPTLGNARNAARDVRCKSNVRTMIQGIHTYMATSGDTLPGVGPRYHVTFTNEMMVFNPFYEMFDENSAKNKSVWVCPNDEVMRAAGPGDTLLLSYVYFAADHVLPGRPTRSEMRRLTTCYLQYPQYPIVGEGSDQWIVPAFFEAYYRHAGLGRQEWETEVPAWKCANQAWLDGSVKHIKPQNANWVPGMPINRMPF